MNEATTTFIFDCFGVICDPVIFQWCKKHTDRTGFVDENLLTVLKRFDLGEVSEDELLEYLLKYPQVTSTRDELRNELDSYFVADTELLKLILKLKAKGFKTMLLSNANHEVFDRKIYPMYPDFKKSFDEIVISSSVQMVKPNADIFLHSLERINSTAEQSLFIDDNEENVEAAIKLGMKGFVYTDRDSFTKYLETTGVAL